LRKTSTLFKHFGKIIPPNLLLPIGILGILIIIFSTFLEYRSREKDYRKLLEDQAKLFLNTVTKSAQNAFNAAGKLEEEINQNLISKLKLIEQIDRVQSLSKTMLRNFLEIGEFEEIQIYDSENKLIQFEIKNGSVTKNIPDNLLITAKGPEQMVMVLTDPLDMNNDRLAVFITRNKGGKIIGLVNPAVYRSFREVFGFGNFLKSIQIDENVKYVVLQNPETIVAGIFAGYTLSTFSNDSYLTKVLTSRGVQTRIIEYPEQHIFEALAPFTLDNEPYGILRLGLSLKEYDSLNTAAKERLIIYTIVIVILAIIFLNFLRAYRHRQLLSHDLNKLQDYTNTILENLGNGVISVDPSGKIQLANKQALILLGKSYSDIFDKHYTIFPNPLSQAIQNSLKNQAFSLVRFLYQQEDSQKYLSAKTSLLNNVDLSKGCIVVLEDVTDEMLLEEQIHRNEKLNAIRKLASTVAHEIRNPLNAISLIIDSLKMRFEPKTNREKYDSNLFTVKSEIARIGKIVEEFLNFSRQPKLKLTKIDFPILFREIHSLMGNSLEKENISIDFNLQDHPILYGDSEQLTQVFVNLIRNAMEAITPPGRIYISGKFVNHRYEVTVEDNGCGMGEDEIKNIFDLYYSKKKNGSGIGLTVVQQIVDAHNGSISVDSKKGKGTVFRLTFPIKNSP
jgi:two-component system sensor histidine kinase HydH